ncbi:hypothetical protein [Tessaracoccus sp. Z1128]
MIVLLTHQSDPWAPELVRQVRHLTGERVGVLTPRDLSRRGWALASPPDDRSGRLIVDGEPVAASTVGLVVSLLDDVLPEELVWIRGEDTEYVAAEMAAFLRFWLDSVSDRVLVPLGALSLAGPDHPTARWAHAGGVPSSGSRPSGGGRYREVSVTNGTFRGVASPSLQQAVAAMARWAEVPWLRAFFAHDRDELCAVVPLPSLGDSMPEAAAAIAAAHHLRRAA